MAGPGGEFRQAEFEEVQALGGHRLFVAFAGGARGIVSVRDELLDQRQSALFALPGLYLRAVLSDDRQAVVWPNGARITAAFAYALLFTQRPVKRKRPPTATIHIVPYCRRRRRRG